MEILEEEKKITSKIGHDVFSFFKTFILVGVFVFKTKA